MTSFASPTSTVPLVFESGVLNVRDDGIVEIYLSHSIDEPHPMLTHPDGEETNIPKSMNEIELVGNGRGTVGISCGIKEVDTLPTGFVFRIQGWKHIQLEMSGDLTVVMSEMEQTPDWFQLGKIHRFDGPEDGVSLFSGSEPFVDIKARPSSPPEQNKTLNFSNTLNDQNQSNQTDGQSTQKPGCGLLILLISIAGFWSGYVC